MVVLAVVARGSPPGCVVVVVAAVALVVVVEMVAEVGASVGGDVTTGSG